MGFYLHGIIIALSSFDCAVWRLEVYARRFRALEDYGWRSGTVRARTEQPTTRPAIGVTTRLEPKEDSDATRREEPVVAVVASVVEQVVGILVDRDLTRARGEDEVAKDG